MASAAASLFLPFTKKNHVVEIQSIKGERKTLLRKVNNKKLHDILTASLSSSSNLHVKETNLLSDPIYSPLQT